jgi:hypothetical protein
VYAAGTQHGSSTSIWCDSGIRPNRLSAPPPRLTILGFELMNNTTRESPASRYYNFLLERDLNDALESWRSKEVAFVTPELPTIAGSIDRHPLLGTDLLLTLFVCDKMSYPMFHIEPRGCCRSKTVILFLHLLTSTSSRPLSRRPYLFSRRLLGESAIKLETGGYVHRPHRYFLVSHPDGLDRLT